MTPSQIEKALQEIHAALMEMSGHPASRSRILQSRLDAIEALITPKPKREVMHGINCKKVDHCHTGYLHSPYDDGPYDVDGVMYCGRCHEAL